MTTAELEQEIARLKAEHVSYSAYTDEELVELIENRKREEQAKLEAEKKPKKEI